MHKIVSKIPLLFLVAATLLFANLQINKRSGGKDFCFNICGDARGYYAWLPAIFLYHDLNFHFYDTVETGYGDCGSPSGIPVQDYRYTFDGKTCNKYYPGAAFMMLPFFALAHAATLLTHHAPDGYSLLYFKIMALSGVFYYFLGMFVFLKILQRLRLNVLQQSLTLILVTFGTNIVYYAIDAPLYSHIYSFTLISAFVLFCLRLSESFSAKNIVWLSFLTGLIFITRPVNITVVLLLPFIVSGGVRGLWQRFAARPVYLLCLLPGLAMPVVLFVLYKLSTGHFFLYSYGKEGFDFLHPHFRPFLLSYDNGVLAYAPMLAMPFLFLFAWYKPEYKRLVWGISLTLLISLYIHSAWWAWSYGFSFGARTVLDLSPLFGILIGLSLKQERKKRYWYLLPAYVACAAFTMLLYNQKSAHGYMTHYPVTDYWEAVRAGIGVKQ